MTFENVQLAGHAYRQGGCVDAVWCCTGGESSVAQPVANMYVLQSSIAVRVLLQYDVLVRARARGGGLGSSTIFKKFNEPYAPS